MSELRSESNGTVRFAPGERRLGGIVGGFASDSVAWRGSRPMSVSGEES
jgi:hypothetical protein